VTVRKHSLGNPNAGRKGPKWVGKFTTRLEDLNDLKLRSCLTLFGHVAPDERIFQIALLRLFGGGRDVRTFELLGNDD